MEKTMKLAGLPLAIALIVSNGLLADQGSAEQHQPDLDALVTHLQLDESKAEQLKGIMQNHYQQRAHMRQQKKQGHEMRGQHEKELLTVLNYEQLYQFRQYMRQQRHQNKRCQSEN